MVYYTYLWLREDGSAYYVGKGSGNRAFKRHRGCCALHPPKDRSRILIIELDSEIDAFTVERELISYYGRKDLGTGCLHNLTDGGDGISSVSIETRQKMRNSHLGIKLSAHHRKKQSEARKGVSHSLEHCAAISKAKTGKRKRPHTKQARARISAAIARWWENRHRILQ
jgi:hypothetical protein